MTKYWLLKSEPEVYSIDHLKKDRVTPWDCVRNYQARNYLQAMNVGDICLFYHSNSNPSAVVGLASVSKKAYPEEAQFDSNSDYLDPAATRSKPRWYSPELRFVEKFPTQLTLTLLRKQSALSSMALLQPGSRLSVQPVTKGEFDTILKLRRKTT